MSGTNQCISQLCQTGLNGDVTTCLLLSQYTSVVSVHACPRPSVMWDLDVILAVITNINSQISSQMCSKCVAAPSNKKQTSRSVWISLIHTKYIPNLSSLHTDDILIATLCMFRKEFTLPLFSNATHKCSETPTWRSEALYGISLESFFSLESNFPCLIAQSPALHSLMWSRSLTPVRPEQLQPLRDCHCWAVGTAGLVL